MLEAAGCEANPRALRISPNAKISEMQDEERFPVDTQHATINAGPSSIPTQLIISNYANLLFVLITQTGTMGALVWRINVDICSETSWIIYVQRYLHGAWRSHKSVTSNLCFTFDGKINFKAPFAFWMFFVALPFNRRSVDRQLDPWNIPGRFTRINITRSYSWIQLNK